MSLLSFVIVFVFEGVIVMLFTFFIFEIFIIGRKIMKFRLLKESKEEHIKDKKKLAESSAFGQNVMGAIVDNLII